MVSFFPLGCGDESRSIDRPAWWFLWLWMSGWWKKPHADCSLTNLGIVPINDLGPDLYQGYTDGLYPNGSDSRPPAHEPVSTGTIGFAPVIKPPVIYPPSTAS